jgi:hypothetical protein
MSVRQTTRQKVAEGEEERKVAEAVSILDFFL